MRETSYETDIVFWMERLEHRLHPIFDSFNDENVAARWEGLRAVLASKLSGFQVAFPGRVGDIFEYLVVFVPYWVGRHLGTPVPDEGILRWFDTIGASWDDASMKRFVGRETGMLTETVVKFFPPAGQLVTRPISDKMRGYQSKGRR